MKSLDLFTALTLLSMNPTLGQDFWSETAGSDDQLNQKSSIQLVSGKSYDSPQANFYQRFVEEIPLHGARVVAESDGDDFLIHGLDQFKGPDTFDATYPVISMNLASTVAEANADIPPSDHVGPWQYADGRIVEDNTTYEDWNTYFTARPGRLWRCGLGTTAIDGGINGFGGSGADCSLS